MTRSAVVSWVVAPLLGALWAVRRLVHTYYFYDEWSMIRLAVRRSPWDLMWTSFNGHLWLLEGLVYRTQLRWFGADTKVLVTALFVLSLIGLHLVVAVVMCRAGVPSVVAPFAALVTVYMGLASQNFVFAVQFSPTLALFAGLAMAVVVLRGPPGRGPTAGVASLGVVAVGLDSAIGAIGLAFSAVVVVAMWRRRDVWVLAPGVCALALWTVLGDQGPQFGAGFLDSVEFGARLAMRSAGALVGGHTNAGLVVIVTAAGSVVFLVRRGAFVGPLRAVVLAAAVATVAAIVGISRSRAGLPGFNFVDFNRYLQNVGLPMALGIFPLWWRTAEVALAGRAPRVARTVALAALAAMFVASMSSERVYAERFIGWNEATRDGVRAALIVIERGCPDGSAPRPDGQPLGGLGPQIDTALLVELLDRGILDAPSGTDVPAEIEAAMCDPA